MEPGEGQPLLQVPIERRASGTSLRIEARAHGVDAPYEPSELSPKQAEFLSHIRISRGVKYFDRQVLNYDSRRLSSLGVVDGAFQAASTFRSGYLWRDSLGLVLYSVAIGSAVALTHRAEDGKCDPEQARSIDEAIRALYPFTGNVLALLPFLLGLYLSTALSRWWSMRTECIGGLWDAMSDMCVLVSSLYPLREHAYIRHRVVRWSLLSHLLIYKEATGDEDLSSLVQEQLLLPDELVRLRSKPIKGQLVWTWMNAFFAHLALDPVAHPLPMREQHLPRIVKLCAKARSSIGGVFSFLSCQLPFRYVHLLSWITWLYCITQATQSGFVGASAWVGCEWMKLFCEALLLLWLPLLFLALLHLAEHLLNPLRSSVIDFPRGALHRFMEEEASALCDAASDESERLPPLWNGDPLAGDERRSEARPARE